jgi:tetratricopeptide (TPR) repeat protein
MGETYFASTIAALLAEALYRLGRYDEAESFISKAEELASEDDVWTQSIWRCVRAKVLVRDAGTAGQAISLTREAIEILQTADAPVWLANGLCDSAEVYEACGEPAEAKAVLEQALALYERKQAPVPAEAVRIRLAGTDTAAAAAVSVP